MLYSILQHLPLRRNLQLIFGCLVFIWMTGFFMDFMDSHFKSFIFYCLAINVLICGELLMKESEVKLPELN